MYSKILSLCLFFANFTLIFSQSIAINEDGSAPNNSTILDIQSTTKRMLVPKMTVAQIIEASENQIQKLTKKLEAVHLLVEQLANRVVALEAKK